MATETQVVAGELETVQNKVPVLFDEIRFSTVTSRSETSRRFPTGT